jgi:hypothetical protein
MSTYEWLLVGAHFLAIGLLVFEERMKLTLRYCLLQPLIFPIGFLGFICVPGYAVGIIRNSLDRESFIDIPFIWIMAHFVWICVALVMAWTLFRWRTSVASKAATLNLK